MNIYTDAKIKNLVDIGIEKWSALSYTEKNRYYADCGTYRFVEELCDEFGINIPEYKDFDAINSMITDAPYEYTVHLNVRCPRELTDIDIYELIASMNTRMKDEAPVEVVLSMFEQV